MPVVHTNHLPTRFTTS